jgi:hypothetical protein
MTLDFGLHDRPVVNIAYDLASPPPLREPLWNLFYSWEHYRPVVEFGAARFSLNPEELVGHVNHYLESPESDRDARRRLFELQVGVPPGHSSSTIWGTLQGIVQ